MQCNAMQISNRTDLETAVVEMMDSIVKHHRIVLVPPLAQTEVVPPRPVPTLLP